MFAGTSADDLEGTWEALKQAEKGRTSVTDGRAAVAAGAVAGGQAAEARRAGSALRCPPSRAWAASCGSSCAGAATPASTRRLALRTTARAYRDRLAAAEVAVLAEGREPASLTPQEWAQRWG